MDKKINQADKLMRQNGAIQTSKTNSWTLRGIKYFFNKHGIFFFGGKRGGGGIVLGYF
jgi:hypothetical protein